jgi:sugar lactone lactonase YvrE
VITNGPAFSPDGRTLYHTDTLEKIIYAFDVDEAGEIANKRVFVRIEDGAGYPDGPTVDADGCIWTGLFAGWSARRYSPKGEVLATVRLPCANVTKIAFGGPDLRDVYATTAWKGLDARAQEAQPLAGGLFRFRADVPGLEAHEVIHA